MFCSVICFGFRSLYLFHRRENFILIIRFCNSMFVQILIATFSTHFPILSLGNIFTDFSFVIIFSKFNLSSSRTYFFCSFIWLYQLQPHMLPHIHNILLWNNIFCCNFLSSCLVFDKSRSIIISFHYSSLQSHV